MDVDDSHSMQCLDRRTQRCAFVYVQMKSVPLKALRICHEKIQVGLNLLSKGVFSSIPGPGAVAVVDHTTLPTRHPNRFFGRGGICSLPKAVHFVISQCSGRTTMAVEAQNCSPLSRGEPEEMISKSSLGG